jgi:hypothetical protein
MPIADPVESPYLFRGHVGQRAADPRAGFRVTQCSRVGQVEVQQHRLAIVLQQDVGRLQIPVDDAPLVGVGQSVSQAGAEPQDRVGIAEPLQPGERFGGWGGGRFWVKVLPPAVWRGVSR